jgi:serine phosphatase RsbU (regulator of sigma subunit)
MPLERQDSNLLTGVYRLLLSRGAHFVLGAATLCAVIFCGWDATRTRPSDGTVWLLGRPELQVLDILPGSGPVTPLQTGDRIQGIGRTIVNSPQSAAKELRRHEPGTEVPYLVERGGEPMILMVPLGTTRVDMRDYAVNVMLALVYLVIGFAVYLRAGDERAPGLFFVLCLLFGLYFMTNLQQVSYFLGALITQNIGAFARFMLPAVFLQFFLVFPRKKLTLTKHPFLAPLLYLLPLMFYLRFTLDQFIGEEGAKIGATSWIVLGLYYVFGLGALLHGYFSYRDPLMRQRVRILTFGTMAAVIPFLVVKIGLEELNFRTGLTRLGVVPLAMIPISFGYCVARYQVLQIDLLLKRNLSYALLTGGIWLSYLGVAWWLGGRLLTVLPAASPLVAAGAALAVAAALWPGRQALQRNIDQRFFLARDNLAALLEEFSKEIPRLIQREVLLERVGRRLCAVLSLPGMAFYLAEGEHGDRHFVLAGRISGLTLPRGEDEGAPLPAPVPYPSALELSALAPVLEQQSEPFWADPGDSLEMESRQAITREQAELKARAREQALLTELGVQLLVPLVAQGRLVGLVALPGRPGDEDWAVHELRLLTIVAGQMALQVENSRLYEEEVAKQKLEEEIAMARQIQARLLPRRIPSYAGVEIGAVNVSSKQVSGDYYDVIEREDGRLGIVIADVSGKGMPASILASNIQAALRAQCDTCESPAEVLERINKQIHASTDPQHFATLFLALFDPERRELRYSSGGHNAPVVLRADGSIELLEKGGLPLGAFDFGTYEEDTIHLAPGDLLFMYTDGLTETKDRDGDEDFGEDRLADLLREQSQSPAGELFDEIHRRLAEFSGRKDADDDITMVAVRIAAEAGEALAQAGGR